MRNVVVTEFITLDGVIEAPGPAEDFEHRGWSMPYWGDDIGAFKNEELLASDALLLGRRTYVAFAAAWPERSGDDFTDKMNSMEKLVASSTLETVEWNNSRLLEGDAAAAVAAEKDKPGEDILVGGSGALVRTLMGADLVDVMRLLVYPVVLGSGKRLFDGAPVTKLELTESERFESGVVSLVYSRPAS